MQKRSALDVSACRTLDLPKPSTFGRLRAQTRSALFCVSIFTPLLHSFGRPPGRVSQREV